ncbi:SRPBCC domain-containing protein [Nocardia uniformis]|uniref:SRPBCC domain-containing protein n=1 Tax=Nocardia uniformis TaxID=53432 RepID=A0A849CE27_9NOCA|nr:SRPBCC domain-containing protein [Nocardia uniformis]NNH71411.1 SRPBCC domain-containing protein [Nocardia uniformis]
MGIENELDPSQVELGRFYPQPPEAVWRALTDSAVVEQWLLPSIGFDGAQVGTHFLFTVPSNPPAEVACEVLAATEGEAMTWSWMDMRGPQPARWIVTWELQPQGHGTRVLLTASGFDIEDKRQRMQRNNLERGWRQVLSKLGDVLERPVA